MKRKKTLLVALLSTTLLGTPMLTACTDTSSNSSQTQVQKILESIEITKMPNKTEYEIGDVFDPTGMEVTAHYKDQSTEVVDNYIYKKTPLSTSDTYIRITYRGKSVDVPITVEFVLKVTSIEVEQMPTKTTYVEGETFDPTGLKITGRWTDNSKRVVPTYSYSKEPLKLGTTSIEISYNDLKTNVPIQVVKEEVNGIVVTKKPSKLAYLVGETFDPAGMEVSTITNKGTLAKLDTADYVIDKTEALTAEDTEVTITYDETLSTTLTISVTESALTKIEITTNPTKTTYKEKETFNPAGMVVTASYEDGSTKAITDYTYDKTNKLTLDDTTVTIDYVGFTATLDIVVNELKDDVVVTGLDTYRVEAEDLDTSMATLRDDFIQAGRTFIENGQGASGGANICGYNPGSIFQIPVTSDKDFEVVVLANMSDTELNYKINDGVQFWMDEELLQADDVKFTYAGQGDYWNWKYFKIGKIKLPAGTHNFSITAVSQRPNLDCFDFMITQYGEEKMETEITELVMETAPTKTTYEPGEEFDPTGMKIVAKYNDYSEKEVTDYVIDKTGPLSEADDKVTISYEGKEIVIPIQVGKEYQLKINETGNERFEAENFNTDNFIYRPEFEGKGYVIDNANASGGKSIEHYDVGSKTELKFFVGEDSKVHLTMGVSLYDDDVLDEVMKVTLDGEVINSDNPTLGHRYDNDYYNWVAADYDSLDLTPGEHTLGIEFIKEKRVPNLDYLDFFVYEYADTTVPHELTSLAISKMPNKTNYIVGDTFDSTGLELVAQYKDSFNQKVTEFTVVDQDKPLTVEDESVTVKFGELTVEVPITVKAPMFIAEETKAYRVEAENCDTSNIVHDGNPNHIESSPGHSSNNHNLGHIKSGYIDIPFTATKAMKLTVTVKFAINQEILASTKIGSFALDSTVYKFGEQVEDVTLGPAPGNDFWNYKDIVINVGDITAGNHTFRITFIGGGNVDCIDFAFTE